MMGIKNYVKSSYADELRSCDTHTGEPYTIGCKICLKIYCPLCLSSAGLCDNGIPIYFSHPPCFYILHFAKDSLILPTKDVYKFCDLSTHLYEEPTPKAPKYAA